MTIKISKNIIESILFYYEEGYGTLHISKKLNISRCTVQKYLKLNTVSLRKRSHNNKYNTNFFEEYTPASCYWAGFILSDGYIRKDRFCLHIKLNNKDNGHLRKFLNTIDSDNNVNHYNNYCYIDINGVEIVNSLVKKFGITTRKSFTMEIHPDIPIEYYSHFIRGIFDGDGCISYSTCPYISFTSASKNILKWLNEYLYSNGLIHLKSRNRVPPIANNISISFSGKNAEGICDFMYAPSTDEIRLTRKFNRYNKMFKNNKLKKNDENI